MTTLHVVQINVGQPRELRAHPNCNRHRDRTVISSMVKSCVTGKGFIHLTSLGLEGDSQADLRVHGGEKKAIYAYPLRHIEHWSAELDSGAVPGKTFGENLTVLGADENDICIGDTFQCGEVVLRVSGPRRPCYKLARHLGDDVPQRMIETGRCGWYFSVVIPGSLPLERAVLKRIAQCEGVPVTVAQAFAEKMRREPGIPGPHNE